MNGEQSPGLIEDKTGEDENLCDGLKLMQVNLTHQYIPHPFSSSGDGGALGDH